MQQMKVPITEILKSNIRDYILVTGDITVVTPPATQVPFKNSAPFTKCITKTDERTMYDAEDLDLVMSMYNLVEYSSNYFKTAGILQSYSKDEAINVNADIVNDIYFKSFENKAKLLGNTAAKSAINAANGILTNATNCCAIKICK